MILPQILTGGAALTCFLVGALFLIKAPKNWPARFLCLGLVCYGLAAGSAWFLLKGHPLLDPPTWAGLVVAWQALALPHWLLFCQSFARKSDEKESALGLVAVSYGISALLFFLVPTTRLIAEVDSAGKSLLGQIGYLYPVYSLLVSVVLLSKIERTFKAADRRQRWQIKFTILAVAGIFGSTVYLDSQALLFSSLDPTYFAIFSAMLEVCLLLLVFSMLRGGVPAVQVYLSGKVIYSSLTLILVGAYLVVTAFITYGIQVVGGTTYLLVSTLFVFLSLLGLTFVLLSEDVRRKLKRFVQYNFFRQEYDYREKWVEVTQKFGSKITLGQIGVALLDILEETLGVNSLSFWLASENGGKQRPFQARGISIEELSGVTPPQSLLQVLHARREPLPVAEVEPESRMDPFWRVTNPQVVVPLFSDQELLGFATLGHRTSRARYTLEDLDLLATIGKQVTIALQTAKLSEQLLAAQELESFHRLSAFFIHDLKNFASTLSLISENGLRCFDEPEFRVDTLESIRRITQQIGDMVTKLVALSKPLPVLEEKIDLSSIVMKVVDEVKSVTRGKLMIDLQGDLMIMTDQILLQNSIRNLLFNANDALNGDGRILVRGWREGESVCLSVEDNGCGMSPAFLRDQLFKPFRTTKPTGAGIGLFQVKKVVEAHRGSLEVASEEGVGTKFIVRLPAVS